MNKPPRTSVPLKLLRYDGGDRRVGTDQYGPVRIWKAEPQGVGECWDPKPSFDFRVSTDFFSRVRNLAFAI